MKRDTERRWAEDIATRLVEAAQAAGADACDATCGTGSSLSAKARDGAIEDVTRSSSRAAGVRVIVDGRLGFATAAEVPSTDAGLRELAETAVTLARISSPSEHNVIPDATAPTGDELEPLVKRLALWDADVAGVDAGWAAEQALRLEKAACAHEGISTVRDAGAGTRRAVFALATSTGFVGSYGATAASMSASAIAADSGGKKQVDGWWTAGRRLAALEDATAVGDKAAARALRKVGARKVASTKAPVIFEPTLARGFVAAILGAINGDIVSRGASFLSDKKGAVLLPKGHAIVDDPLRDGGLASHPFDGEGLRVHKTPLFDDEGRLLTFLHDARSAHRMGEAPTGHAGRGSSSMPSPGASNVVVEGGAGDLASIIAETERGLLVTQLLGHSPDMITGDYSRGASGFWIEDGAIAFPVEEVTIAGHMLEMMKGIDRIGADAEERSSLLVGTLRFAELAISGS